jgi:hypothetical protein
MGHNSFPTDLHASWFILHDYVLFVCAIQTNSVVSVRKANYADRAINYLIVATQ